MSAIKLVTPPPVDAALRDDLARAIQERDAAAAKRDAIRDTLERSSRFVHELDERLQAVAERDAQAVRERAEHFKAALVEATTPTLSVSAKLSTTALQRLEAENTAEAARQAHEAIAAELEEAEDRLILLNGNVLHAAKAIVGAYADKLAAELREAEHAAALLRRRLLGASQMRPGGPFPLNAATMSVLRGDNDERYSRAEPSDTKYFDDFLARLQSDASATIEDA